MTSDRPLAEVKAALESHFGNWQGEGPAGVKAFAVAPQQVSPRILLIDRPDSPQSLILAAQMTSLLSDGFSFGDSWTHYLQATGRYEVMETVVNAEPAQRMWARERSVTHSNERWTIEILQAQHMPTDLFTPIFAISRTAGWTANILEQLADNRLYRPLSEYVGKAAGRAFAPIDQR